MTRRFQFSFWARPMRAAWAFLVSGILVCGPTWFIYGWGRDTAFGYGAQERDAGKIGVMAVICYEMLLIPSVAAVRLMFPRRQIDSPPPTVAHAISCWVAKKLGYTIATLYCVLGTFLLLGSAACLAGTVTNVTPLSDAIILFVVGMLCFLIAAVVFYAARTNSRAWVSRQANDKQSFAPPD